MKHFTNFFLLALCAALFINLMSCDKECPEPVDPNACNPNGSCNNGYECVNGACACPEPGYVLGGYCAQFGTDANPAWKGLSSACYCYDTLGFGIIGQGVDRTLSMAFVEGGQLGSASTGIKYYPMPSGDSFYVFQMPIKCVKPGAPIKIVPEAFGKLKANGDMVLRLVFRDAISLQPVDECITTLEKVK